MSALPLTIDDAQVTAGAAVAGTPDSSTELLDQVWATDMRAGQTHVAIADAGGSPSRRRQTCSAP